MCTAFKESSTNTLHVRAGRPTPYDIAIAIAIASRWHLAVEEIAPVLEGTQIPSRSLLSRLLHVLGGDPDYFIPLWEKASAEHRHLHTHEPTKTPEAAAKLERSIQRASPARASTAPGETTRPSCSRTACVALPSIRTTGRSLPQSHASPSG
jgi:hypothetical protein